MMMRNVLKNLYQVRNPARIPAGTGCLRLYNLHGAGGKAWMRIGRSLRRPVTASPTEPAVNLANRLIHADRQPGTPTRCGVKRIADWQRATRGNEIWEIWEIREIWR